MTNCSKCSFCGREDSDSIILVGNDDTGTFICETCWNAVGRAMGKPKAEIKEVKKSYTPPKMDWSALNPAKIKAYLDQHIIGQERAKKILSVAVYNHYKMLDYRAKHAKENGKEKIRLEKSNILMVGPTGVGKTALLKALADVLQVPFAITDATTMTESGYVGADPESCIQRLLRAADGDVARAETGIVYIDEIDKLACKGENMSITRDVSGEGVQQALLKIIEGTRLDLQEEGSRRHPMSDTVDIDTSNILFIVGGAFVHLDEFIRARVQQKGSDENVMGFCVEAKTKKERVLSYNEIIDKVAQEDIRRYGIIPELLGRLPVIAPLHELSTADLCHILIEPKNSLVKQYQEIFHFDNVDLLFTDGALQAMADRAVRNGTGARGLRSILENVLLDKMYAVTRSTERNKIVITKREVDRAFADFDEPAKLAG